MEQTIHTRGPTMPPIIKHIAGAVAFGTLAAWLANGLVCYHQLWAWCGGSAYVTIAALVALFVLTPLAYTYRERAIRRASKGMWSRSWHRGPGHELTATFNRVVKLAIQGEEEADPAGLITGTDRYKKLGWWIDLPIDGGTRIWVDRWELWRWLIEVEGLRYQLKPGESPIGRGYWEPRIGRELWMAYVIILESIGVADCRTGDPRSRRYRGSGDTWGVVEEYEKWRKSRGLSASEER